MLSVTMGYNCQINVTFKSSKKIFFEENLTIWASMKCHLIVFKVSVELSLQMTYCMLITSLWLDCANQPKFTHLIDFFRVTN